MPVSEPVSLALISCRPVPCSLFLRYRRHTTPATVSSTAAAPTLAPTMIAICLVLSGFAVVSAERAVAAVALSTEEEVVVVVVVVGVVGGRSEKREMKTQ